MCGIAGLVSSSTRPLPATAERLARSMAERLVHRGPEDGGVFLSTDGRVAFSHRRLSIIDLTTEAHQPMVSPVGNAIVFNGEIYNFRELAKRHAVGPSASDTSILLQLLERRGLEILPEIVGFFTFAYYDVSSGVVTIARDRFGKKPLYYRQSDGVLAFASELGALMGAGSAAPSLDREALAEYLRYYSVPHPLTLVHDVLCLPPASVLTVADGEVSVHRWWHLPDGTIDVSYDEAVRGVRQRLERSVQYRMVADVPVGAFLSGGLDSNAIVGLMSCGKQHLKTFTIGFAGFTKNETDLARISARHYQTEHHEHTYSDVEVAELLPEFFASMDSPTGDGLNSFLVSHFARRNDPDLKVIVTGTGGDELFLGYKKYRWMAQHGTLARIVRLSPFKSWVRRSLGKVTTPAASLALSLLSPGETRVLFSNDEISQLLSGVSIPQKQVGASTLEELLATDIEHYLPDMLLRDMDVYTMAHSFEARVPLLDGDLFEYVWQLPIEFRSRGQTKQLLIDATRDVLPQQLLTKPKTGFELPLSIWLRHGALRPWLDRLITGDLAVVRDGVLAEQAVHNIYTQFNEGRTHYLKPWSIIALDEWYRHFLLEVVE